MRWFIAVAALALPTPLAAQGWIEPIPRPFPQVQRVEKLRTSVTVRVTGRIARVEVEEWFRNNGGGLAEGDYHYPLPGEAVFSDFSLFQGEEELRGETMDAERARSIYEEIVRRQRDPALIELAGHGLLRARIFPIGPGETRKVTLRYTQVLAHAGDAYHFRYLVGTSRSGHPIRVDRPAGGAVVDRSGTQGTLTFTLVADSASRFAEPFSPTHRLRSSREGERLVVRPADELSGSFDVFLPLARSVVGVSVATHRVDNEDGYFMLTLSPGRVRGAPAARDVAVVVDVSGSMSGEKMEQARQALHQLVGTLSANDRFRLISFSSRVNAHHADWASANRQSIDEARGWIDRLVASGGTNIAGALDEAFRTPSRAGRLHIVIFITDGLPTVGETNPERIAAGVEATRGDARIFAFGVGYDLNTYLLERIAVAGNGTVDYVEPRADVETAVSSLALKISHPVLVDLAIAGAPVRLKDVQPRRLPDLYAGEELVIFGRYESGRGHGGGELAITGTRNGRTERFAARVEFPARNAANAYIAGLWAARRVGELMRTIRIEGATPERVEEVRQLALRYGLLTEFTSYLVLEPGEVLAHRPGDPRTPSAAPQMAVTGEAAVRSAQNEAARRDARTLAEVARAEAAAMDRLLDHGAAAAERVVAGRRFRMESGAWSDVGHKSGARVVELEPYSDAYFAVLQRLPELRPYWGVFESVTVAGGRVSIRLAAGGRSRMNAAELNTLVTDFRSGAKRTE